MHLSWAMLLAVAAAAKNTTIGLETIEEGSKTVSVPMGDCHTIDSYEVTTVSVKKPCRFFTGPMCIGRQTLLRPGVHESDEPVPIWSVFCEDEPEHKLELRGCVSGPALYASQSASSARMSNDGNYNDALFCLRSLPAVLPKEQYPGVQDRFDDFVACTARSIRRPFDTTRAVSSAALTFVRCTGSPAPPPCSGSWRRRRSRSFSRCWTRAPRGRLGAHAAVHVALGPTMGDVFSSVQDPAFFLHHAMVDRLWGMWQEAGPGRRDALNGTAWMFDPPWATNVSVDTVVEFGVLGGPRKIADLMDPLAGQHCYIYS
ncbi:hypothetical protein KXW42_006138 [Aspergillus fumigatus]|nr:hypothetical protein KXX48_006307 [Aspergillus fumigatus]KAH1439643.1 hypothetical protein KXX68_004579 [Aspergillus fumigatus]KAH2251618.1 hypothetical protein KXW72_004138 [Aspergillus fumigatus]KAH2488557.1 hypothetical protein KXW70_005717 [Aspergillus fumigatus]KAH2560152.1 hypothetical protein KXV42_005225 [Aspergillus fumigatus]